MNCLSGLCFHCPRESRLERCQGEWLRQNPSAGESLGHSAAVAGTEYEGDIARREAISDWPDELSPEFAVQDGGIQPGICINEVESGLDASGRTGRHVSKQSDHVLKQHPDDRVIFDD